MNRKYLVCLCLCISTGLHAQLNEEFSGLWPGIWKGDTADFMINHNHILSLDADTPGQSLIYTELDFVDPVSWRFDLELDFAPSNNNSIKIILAASNSNYLSGQSVVLHIGENGSEDAICLRFLDEGVVENELKGSPGLVAQAFKYSFEIDKSFQNQWTIRLRNKSSGIIYFEIDTIINNSGLANMGYFGILSQYTQSNRNGIHFDNIKIDESITDLDPPYLRSFELTNEPRVIIRLNEPIDTMLFGTKFNITCDDIDLTKETTIISWNPSLLKVDLPKSISSCSPYTFIISGIQDIYGNTMSDTTITHKHYANPFPLDIRINEILADPLPGDSDFIELLNTSSKFLTLEGCSIENKAKEESEPLTSNLTIHPGEYLVLTEDKLSLLMNHPRLHESTVHEVNLPSFNNESGNVTLSCLDSFGDQREIDSFDYSDLIHDHSLSETEGISLERIHSIGFTQNVQNWQSSASIEMASPGNQNSVAYDSKDFVAKVVDSTRVDILLADQVDSILVQKPEYYSITDYDIDSIDFNINQPNKLVLNLATVIDPLKTFHLNIISIPNQCGNRWLSGSVELFRIETPSTGDILINEVLFDPEADGSDFIEIINTSPYYLSLDRLRIQNALNAQLTSLPGGLILRPFQIQAFSEDTSQLVAYYNPPDSALIHPSKLPALNNESGNVSLWLDNPGYGLLIDSVNYHKEQHFALLTDTEGVSLERISTEITDNSKDNWSSAAQNVGFATPGYKNSNRIDSLSISSEVELESKVFSPDHDGYFDQLILKYSFHKPGFISNIDIFDDRGFHVRHLSQNTLLSTSGIISWDGLDTDSNLLPVGIYIIKYQFFHPDGELISGKRLCVLAQQMND